MNTKVKGDKIKEGSIPLSALDDDFKFRYSECPSVSHSNIEYIDITNFKVGDKFTINRTKINFWVGIKSVEYDKVIYNEEFISTSFSSFTKEIPYNESTITAEFKIDNNCVIMTIKSGINVGSKCILEIYDRKINELDDKFLSNNIVRKGTLDYIIYDKHLFTMINIDTRDLVTDINEMITDYKGITYDGLEGLINSIKTTIAYCLANFLTPQIHLVDWKCTMPAVFCSDPRTFANEDDDYETIVNKLHNNGFTVIFGAGHPDAGGVIVRIDHAVEEGLYFYLYEY